MYLQHNKWLTPNSGSDASVPAAYYKWLTPNSGSVPAAYYKWITPNSGSVPAAFYQRLTPNSGSDASVPAAFYQRLTPNSGSVPAAYYKWLTPNSGSVPAACYKWLTHTKLWQHTCSTLSTINPFTAPACKISRLKACKQFIFRSYNNLLSMLCVSMKILSRASAKKKTKMLKRFRFCTFIGCF